MQSGGRGSGRERFAVASAAVMGWVLIFPPSAYAVEVGCFCTFAFFSLMATIGVGLTVISKRVILTSLWSASWKRIILVTGIEIFLLVSVLIVYQAAISLRLLAYLPIAFLLNYALGAGPHAAQAVDHGRRKRLAISALLSVVFPIAVLLTVWLWLSLSNMITFKEVRV